MIEYKAYRDTDGVWVPFYREDKMMGTNGEIIREITPLWKMSIKYLGNHRYSLNEKKTI